jgi:hypothetical protein
MKFIRFLVPFISLMLGSAVWGQIKLINSQSVPRLLEEVSLTTPWKPAGRLKIHEKGDLSGFDNVAILEEYGLVRTYQQTFKGQETTVEVTLFEMVDSPAAYGLFTFQRNLQSRPLSSPGELAEMSGSVLSFVQNRYYLRLKDLAPEGGVSDTMRQLGTALSKRLPKGLGLPPLLGKLPRENHVPQSTLFVMGPAALNTRLPMGGKDLFGLASGAEAVLTEYRTAQDSALLLLIAYPTQQLAKNSLETGYQSFTSAEPEKPVLFKREGYMAALVIGAQTPEFGNALLDQVSHVSMVSWDPKTQPLTVARMMINIFIFLGILLLIALAAGLLFAAIRILARQCFPGKLFDRPNMQLIRLNLQNYK